MRRKAESEKILPEPSPPQLLLLLLFFFFFIPVFFYPPSFLYAPFFVRPSVRPVGLPTDQAGAQCVSILLRFAMHLLRKNERTRLSFLLLRPV